MSKKKLRVTPSEIASFLDFLLPGDELIEKDRGTGISEPEQPSTFLLPQIKGFPTILNVLAGNLGTGPLRLLYEIGRAHV